MPRLPRWNAKQAIKILVEYGFVEVRSGGSHRIYYNHLHDMSITVPFHGSKVLSDGVRKNILKVLIKVGFKL